MEPRVEQIKLITSASFHTQTNFRTHKTSHRIQPVVLLCRESCFQLCNLCLDSAEQLPRFSAFSWNWRRKRSVLEGRRVWLGEHHVTLSHAHFLWTQMAGGHFGGLLVFLWRSAPASGPPCGCPTTKVIHYDEDDKKLKISVLLWVG